MRKKEIKIGKKTISEASPPFIIAEAGVNYYDIAKKEKISVMAGAKLMIKEAAKAGADAIKFQTYKTATLASKFSAAYWDTTKEKTASQYELFKRYDKFSQKDYKELANSSKQQGIIFLSTPFDEEAVDFLDSLVPAFKVASADINNFPLLKRIAQKKKPIFLSTGASTIQEINDALGLIKKEGNNQVVILHCILNYPTQYENANLKMICGFKKNYPDYIIGYSDHTLPDDNMAVLAASHLLGARVIEKHFTLDKSLPGNDHYHAMDCNDLKKLKQNFSFLEKILGDEEKKPLASEGLSRKYARRSIVAGKRIPKGKIITVDDLMIKRPGTGIEPRDFNKVIGSKSKRDIQEDEILQFSDFKK